MAIKLPHSLKVLGQRASVLLTPVFGLPARIQQMVTYREGFPVTTYTSIRGITAATSVLKWTSDPWDGKLDVIKHPTFMEEAIQRHPEYAGDCDDFAAYWCVALKKGKLADEVWFASAMWNDETRKKISGHAVCVFRTGQNWYYAGNWDRCVPIPIKDKKAWAADISDRVACPIITAVMWHADRGPDDSLLIGDTFVVKY